MTRRSLKLSPKDWQRLQDIATATDSCATKGTTMGQPTWRALIRRIAQGELMINERNVFPIERLCLWCGKSFVRVMANCGTGTTWSLYKCPHCEKFTAEGWIIPDAVRDDPNTKIIETEPPGDDDHRKHGRLGFAPLPASTGRNNISFGKTAHNTDDPERLRKV